MSAATDDLRLLPAHAADLIDRVGWTQGTECDGAGRVCLTGALRYCNPQPGDWLIAREIFRAKGRAEGWNDASERTCNEVVELLRSTEITDATFYIPKAQQQPAANRPVVRKKATT